ncbi:putative uncharacterized transposon-derived protein F54H12.3 [Trichonephila clavipes]|nr:putative uncharacterized transposon-derived protein F54H12.3 [Trichonephila clavipes]
MSKFSRQNKGIKFLLTSIDVFSKKAYAQALKNKSANVVLEAFQKLLKQIGPIKHLQTDQGKEFYNKTLQNLFTKNKINHYSSHSEYKASVVERFNRTLKNKLFRIFTHRGSYKYIDTLSRVLKSYNDSIHRSTSFAPNQVTSKLEPIIFRKLYGYKRNFNYKFNIGEQVRISKSRKTFQRGYLPNWSEEVFTIVERFPSNPPTYFLKDFAGIKLKGRFSMKVNFKKFTKVQTLFGESKGIKDQRNILSLQILEMIVNFKPLHLDRKRMFDFADNDEDDFLIATKKQKRGCDKPNYDLDLSTIDGGAEKNIPPYVINLGKGLLLEVKCFRGSYYVGLSKVGEAGELDTLRENCGIICKQASTDGGVLWKVVRVNVVQVRRKYRFLRDPREARSRVRV